ncbi:MAG: hypothetical protein PHZ00_08215, partial [Candidatus Peribacteraceae bacterium]|nr:hypothetical protein [Candidatus Peribacteraceae bacterium]
QRRINSEALEELMRSSGAGREAVGAPAFLPAGRSFSEGWAPPFSPEKGGKKKQCRGLTLQENSALN